MIFVKIIFMLLAILEVVLIGLGIVLIPYLISKIVEIPFSGKFLERYKKDNQGNYKYMKED